MFFSWNLKGKGVLSKAGQQTYDGGTGARGQNLGCKKMANGFFSAPAILLPAVPKSCRVVCPQKHGIPGPNFLVILFF